MVTIETHQSQDLLVPAQDQDLLDQQDQNDQDPAMPSLAFPELDLEKMSQGPVNAITVLTLLDKLVNMLDAVQENQHKMEVRLGGSLWRLDPKISTRFRVQRFRTKL